VIIRINLIFKVDREAIWTSWETHLRNSSCSGVCLYIAALLHI